MHVHQAIKTRKSIRKYQNKKIPQKLIRELLEAARLAPSGLNTQPWKFYVIKDKKVKNKLRQAKIFKQDFVTDAPVIIVCTADPRAYKSRVKGSDDENHIRAARDLSIASSFLVLRATELGLGTCFVGWVKRDKIKKLLKIPQRYIISYVIPVGYPAEKPKTRQRKKMKEIVNLL